MEKLIFGDKQSIRIASIKKLKRQKTIPVPTNSTKNLTTIELCNVCMKNVDTEIYNISHLFTFICNKCKNNFINYANKENILIIGAFVRVKNKI